MEESLDDKIRTLQKIKAEIGFDVDFDAFVARFNQIDSGLIHEDEFLFLLGWSGRCLHFNKLDQSILLPGSKENYTVPDIMAVLEVEGEPKTFFIEIKTTAEKKTLKWTKAYYEGLLRYARLFNAEVLVAWKWNVLDIWTLFELNHFQNQESSYKINLEKAHKENLTSTLLGDYVVFLEKKVALNFKHKKLEKVSVKENETTWTTQIVDIFYTVNSERVPGRNNGVFSMLLSLQTEVETEDHADFVLQRYTPDPNTSSYAQSIVIRLAKADIEEETKWVEKIRNAKYPVSYSKLLESLIEAKESGMVKYVAFIKPYSENNTDAV